MAFLPPRPQHFDDLVTEEFGEQPVPQQVVSAQDRENRILSSVENRLSKANYYRLVLENPLFSDGESEAAYEVEAEFRNYALERLQVLMGERPERLDVDLPEEMVDVLRSFSPLQLQALKLWADTIIARDPSMAKAVPPAPPKMNTVAPQQVVPPPSLNMVKAEQRKPRARKQPKIEPRKPSLVAVAQQARQQVVVQPQIIQPRVPQRPAPALQPAQAAPAPMMPAPTEVLHHFQQAPVPPPAPIQQVAPPAPVAPPVQQAPIVQQAQQIIQQAQPTHPPEFSNAETGAFVDPTGRTYELKEYVDHRTGETKQHRVYHQSQVMPKGDLVQSGMYQKPSEKAALFAMAERDTEGKSMVMRFGGNPWDKMGASVNALGASTIQTFQRANANVNELE